MAKILLIFTPEGAQHWISGNVAEEEPIVDKLLEGMTEKKVHTYCG